jgi:hypothetical protein
LSGPEAQDRYFIRFRSGYCYRKQLISLFLQEIAVPYLTKACPVQWDKISAKHKQNNLGWRGLLLETAAISDLKTKIKGFNSSEICARRSLFFQIDSPAPIPLMCILVDSR